MLYKNKACTKEMGSDSRSNGMRIIWSAEDATQYSFKVGEGKDGKVGEGKDEKVEEGKDEETVTVYDYFKKNHGITLKYPNMPILFLPRISKYGGGWYV